MRAMPKPAILWFRQDLRLADNPALHAIADRPILPVFILDAEAAGAWAEGGASRWWLHHSLEALSRDLKALGAPLLVLRGAALDLLPKLAAEMGADEIHAGRLSEPWARARDAKLAEALQGAGRRLVLHRSALLHEPHLVRTGTGKPYAVYTPFSRTLFGFGDPAAPIPAPGRL
ncbi:MAG: deoxyribodipyrimidine photo-lyase, partial [Acetobacteraceae bacterium]|nr:deoxyribodipyrimidine photo-lyase [Acetobacteraceae bacterium]